MPNAALRAVIAGLLRIVPYVGTMIAAAPAITFLRRRLLQRPPPSLVFLLFRRPRTDRSANFVEPWLYGAKSESLLLLALAGGGCLLNCSWRELAGRIPSTP